MIMLFRLTSLLILIFFLSTQAESSDIERLRTENQLLESELKLTTKPNIYFVFNLKDKKVGSFSFQVGKFPSLDERHPFLVSPPLTGGD